MSVENISLHFYDDTEIRLTVYWYSSANRAQSSALQSLPAFSPDM